MKDESTSPDHETLHHCKQHKDNMAGSSSSEEQETSLQTIQENLDDIQVKLGQVLGKTVKLRMKIMEMKANDWELKKLKGSIEK